MTTIARLATLSAEMKTFNQKPESCRMGGTVRRRCEDAPFYGTQPSYRAATRDHTHLHRLAAWGASLFPISLRRPCLCQCLRHETTDDRALAHFRSARARTLRRAGALLGAE